MPQAAESEPKRSRKGVQNATEITQGSQSVAKKRNFLFVDPPPIPSTEIGGMGMGGVRGGR